MGKSPGKWIKTILFGKKASRSSIPKGRYASKATDDKETWIAAKEPTGDLPVDPPSVSEPNPGTTDSHEENSLVEKGVASSMPHGEGGLLSRNRDVDKQETIVSGAPNEPDQIKLEQAAAKVQAAFRGYLARRAFWVLRGIIRLQALVRGHLVRRQAVATLRCMHGIIRFQALVRGQRVNLSNASHEVFKTGSLRRPLLLRSSPSGMPLRLQYGPDEPNSAWNWLERWTSSHFWVSPHAQPKKVVDPKYQSKQGSLQSVETEPSRSRRTVRRPPVVAAHADNGAVHLAPESEKPRRNFKKSVGNHPVVENPPNELENVKRNLRKVSTSTTIESTVRPEVETEKKSKRSVKKAASNTPTPDTPEIGACNSLETMEEDVAVSASKELDVENTTKSVISDGPTDVPLENIVTDEELTPANDKTSHDNQKSSRRRASASSFQAKHESPVNGLQNTPKLPSYMAATESAKAKLRAQGSSPSSGQDESEKSGSARRHSLPSLTNGKVSSLSPRMQSLVQTNGKGRTPVQANGKGGTKTEKSLLSSRDGTIDKVGQAGWRR